MKRIIPSANQLFLAEELGAFPKDTPLHIDIEDGNFVNNITFGMRTVRSIAALFPNPLCFHFMAKNPSQYFGEIAKCNAREVAVHFEELPYPSEELCALRQLGLIPGLAINVKTPVEQVAPFFEYIDFLLLMTMDCGFGGTNGLGFCGASHDRIRTARNLLPPVKNSGWTAPWMRPRWATASISGPMRSSPDGSSFRKKRRRKALPAGPTFQASANTRPPNCWPVTQISIV